MDIYNWAKLETAHVHYNYAINVPTWPDLHASNCTFYIVQSEQCELSFATY